MSFPKKRVEYVAAAFVENLGEFKAMELLDNLLDDGCFPYSRELLEKVRKHIMASSSSGRISDSHSGGRSSILLGATNE